jgi:putative membrane protein
MHMNNHPHHDNGIILQLLVALPFLLALIIYSLAVITSSLRHKQWPLYRTVFGVFGVLCAAAAVVGPLGNRAHTDFTAHMLGHLLLGMIAPLLIVLAAPMTLFLRTLNVISARRLSRVLRSWPARIGSDPLVASCLNIGGLWVLYATDLYVLMQQNIFLHMGVHTHIFFAGYLFTVSMIYFDPTPHRTSFFYRSIVLVIALAGHGILSKYIYAHPPSSVPVAQAETGGMLMYYGGDAINLILICIFCYQWFRATRPRSLLSRSPHDYE